MSMFCLWWIETSYRNFFFCFQQGLKLELADLQMHSFDHWTFSARTLHASQAQSRSYAFALPNGLGSMPGRHIDAIPSFLHRQIYTPFVWADVRIPETRAFHMYTATFPLSTPHHTAAPHGSTSRVLRSGKK